MVDNDSDDKEGNTDQTNKEEKAKANETTTRSMEGSHQMGLQHEFYLLHTLYNPEILEEEKAEITCMGLMDLSFSTALENEGEEISSIFQEV